MKFILHILFILFSIQVTAQNTFTAKYDVAESRRMKVGTKEVEKILKYDGFLFKKNNTLLTYLKPQYLKEYPKGRIDLPDYHFMTLNMDTLQLITFSILDSFYLRSVFNQTDKLQPFCMYYMLGTNKWEILPETKNILGVTCQRAVMHYPTPNDLYADIWFNPKIQFGGSDFLGIREAPGLIMEGEMPTNLKKFKMTEYQINPPVTDAQMILKELEAPCTPRRGLSAEQLKANKKRMKISTQVDF